MIEKLVISAAAVVIVAVGVAWAGNSETPPRGSAGERS